MKRALSFCAAAFAAALGSFSANALTQEQAQEPYDRVHIAAHAYVAARLGQSKDCREVGAALEKRRAEFLLAARLSYDVYRRADSFVEHPAGKATRQEIKVDGQKITRWFDPASKGYAEVHHDAQHGAKIIVFRETYPRKFGPERYLWAERLAGEVIQSAPPRTRILLVGHSLGGGLASYAALAHDLEAVVFNPVGLSREALNTLDFPNPTKGAQTIVAFIARSGETLDPVSALSLAGASLIPGRRYLVERPPGLDSSRIHNMTGLARDMEKISNLTACDADIGVEWLL